MTLVAADESFDHTVVDHPSWTEKVCAMAAPRDGSIQAAFGMGKYANRNVLDAYAGVSRGVEQWTVRASRHLGSELSAGPISYEVVEPLNVVRFALAENDVVPISFEWTFRGALPAAREDESSFEKGLVRYHQIGTAEGWIALDGVRHELTSTQSVSTRDHSWGVRRLVGKPETETPHRANVTSTVIWSPILMPGYGIHVFYQRHAMGEFERAELIGGVEHPDGRREPFAAMVPTYDVDDATRRLRRAVLRATMEDGSERPLTVTALGDTGFHLGTGLYFGFDGHWHGEDRGPLHVDGEYIADCSEPATARRVHQIRDNLVRVEDPVGGAVGIGNMQTIFSGPHPDAGLSEEMSFM
ncbi:MAG TPA: hypothetical protein VHC63_16245 [Acidimicrobiales bacterium]|nr:hypothetical protein [Acidimicrobiales bacterium]